ncbi:MAG: dihydropteroate synthase [Myxococcota bacterium]|nr:dihydropteroate synthase [Myxococcota bacterium]
MDSFFLGRRRYPARGPTLVMGIVNVTPDSFSDGGRYLDPAAAILHGRQLVEAGADLLDVGGESTRPGSPGVDAACEQQRVLPVIEALARTVDVPISIDTTKPEVARAALDAGATVINDVRGLRAGDELARLAADRAASLILMHSRGTPADMQQQTHYDDLLGEVGAALGEAAETAMRAGVPRERLVLDPGIGFAKEAVDNLRLLNRLGRLVLLGYPVLVGPSRKAFLGKVTGLPVGERLMGTAAACVAAILAGARLVRVHDVALLLPGIRVADAIREERIR